MHAEEILLFQWALCSVLFPMIPGLLCISIHTLQHISNVPPRTWVHRTYGHCSVPANGACMGHAIQSPPGAPLSSASRTKHADCREGIDQSGRVARNSRVLSYPETDDRPLLALYCQLQGCNIKGIFRIQKLPRHPPTAKY